MKLTIVTPAAIVADYDDIVSLRAEDESGWFGVLPGHADFLTALAVSVMSWRHADGRSRYCAVRGGVLTVNGGASIRVATAEALPGDELETLEAVVRQRLAAEAEEEREARSHAARLQVQAIRQIIGYLRPERRAPPGEPS